MRAAKFLTPSSAYYLPSARRPTSRHLRERQWWWSKNLPSPGGRNRFLAMFFFSVLAAKVGMPRAFAEYPEPDGSNGSNGFSNDARRPGARFRSVLTRTALAEKFAFTEAPRAARSGTCRSAAT